MRTDKHTALSRSPIQPDNVPESTQASQPRGGGCRDQAVRGACQCAMQSGFQILFVYNVCASLHHATVSDSAL